MGNVTSKSSTSTDMGSRSEYTEAFENIEDILPESIKHDIQILSKNDDWEGIQSLLRQHVHSEKFRHVIEQLNLQEYYPKRLTREKALIVPKTIIKPDDLTDSGKIPWFILQNLIICNYEGRSFEVSKTSTSFGKGHSFSDFLESTSEATNVGMDSVSPADALVALFMCSDDFLRQLLVEKLFLCQLAIPLILPTVEPNHTYEILLWASSSLKKQWKGSSDITMEKSMVLHPFPIVSALRIGRPPISKSKTLNYIINEEHHDTFFHHECKGGTLEKSISDGVLDLAWYLPNRENHDNLPDALMFLNLRGNASHLRGQTSLMSIISLVTIVFTSFNNFDECEQNLLESLYKQKGHLIFLVDGHPSESLKESIMSLEQKYPKKEDRCVEWIDFSKENELKVSRKIKRILHNIKRENEYCIQSCSLIAKEIGFYVDQSHSGFLNEVIKKRCKRMIENLKTNGKENCFTLQVISKKIGDKTKEQHRLKQKGTMQTEAYVEKMKSDITSLRHVQRDQSKIALIAFNIFKTSFISYSHLERKYFHSYVKIMTDRYCIDTLQPVRQEYIKKWNELCDTRQKQNTKLTEEKFQLMKAELDCLEQKISDLSIGLEHFNREIGQLYEMSSHLKILKESTRQLPDAVAEMLLHGYPLELMDGDASCVPVTWIQAVFSSLIDQIGNQRMFILSVLGVQSSGKSTMLNAMFGLQFSVSAGRCTKGVFAQLVALDKPLQKQTKFNYILVVDTEGLRAPELASSEHNNHDNELATLVIGLGDATIINIMGENALEMQDTLQIVVHAFMKMENVNIKPSCIFVHQNINDVAASDLNTSQKRKIRGLLDEITIIAAKEENCSDKYRSFSDVINFQENKHIMYISTLWKGDPPMAPPNPGYSRCILKVKKQIIEFMQTSKVKTFKDFTCRLSDLWKAILCQNFVFSFRNSLEIQAFNTLETEYVKQSRALRRSAVACCDILKSKCRHLTADEIKKDGPVILKQQLGKIDVDINIFRKSMEGYFSEELKACQWKGKTEIKINELCIHVKKELNEEFQSIKKKVIGRNEIDSNVKRYESDISNKAKALAEKFRDKQLTESDLQREFDENWEDWISSIPTSDSYIDIDNSFEAILEELSLSRDKEEVSRIILETDLSQVQVCEHDIDFDRFGKLNWRQMFGFGFNKSKQACVDIANGITQIIRQNALKQISTFKNEGRNFSINIASQIYEFLTQKFKDAKIADKLSFKEKGKIRLTVCNFKSLVPSFKAMQARYNEENDLRLYMKSQKDRLWQMFRDECMMVQISVSAAVIVSQELERAIHLSLPDQCKTGVIDYLRTCNSRAFANKMSFHAQMLIDLAEKGNFMAYRQYLTNPVLCMNENIAKFIEIACLDQNVEGNTVLRDTYNKKVHMIFSKVRHAIDISCEECNITCTMKRWWPKLLTNMCDELSIKKTMGFFNEDGQFNVGDLRGNLLNELAIREKSVTESFQESIFNKILEPCRQFFDKDLLGCPELCPFCKSPCDLQLGDKYDDHRTEYHRPQGVAGYHDIHTKKIVTNLCTTDVMSTDMMFRNKDTDGKFHFYKKYQSVNEYYKSWKIQPMAGESQLYWKWFMATYNEELAEYYDSEPADIPDGWNQISWELAKEDMINTYNL